jgi:hypothetical protein
MSASGDDPLVELARLEGVGSAMTAARDAVDVVLRDRGRRTVTPEQSVNALLIAARASAALAAEDAAVDGAASDVLQPSVASWEAPAVRLYTELTELAGLIRVSPGQAIARAHAVLARGLIDDDDLGRPRASRSQDPSGGVGERMAALHRLLATPSEAPVIVLAGIAHAELFTMAPFVAGNGLVARAVEHMILIAGDLDAPAATVPEAGHRQQSDVYRWALGRYRTGTATGVRDWLLHVAEAVTVGAELSPLKPTRFSRP